MSHASQAASDERRNSRRREIAQGSTLRHADGRPEDIVVRDLSRDGFAIETSLHLDVGNEITVGLPGVGAVRARVTRAQASGYGCETLHPLTAAALAKAFAEDPVVSGSFPPLMFHKGMGCEPKVGKWPAATRLVAMVAGAGALWTVVVAVVWR